MRELHEIDEGLRHAIRIDCGLAVGIVRMVEMNAEEARDINIDTDPKHDAGPLVEALDDCQGAPFSNQEAISYLLIRITPK